MKNNPSQFRKYTKIKLINKIRTFIHKFRLGNLGKNVFIGKNVSLSRFTKNISIGNDVF